MIDEGMTYRVASAVRAHALRADSREATAKVVPQQELPSGGSGPGEVKRPPCHGVAPYDFHVDGKCRTAAWTSLHHAQGGRTVRIVLAWTVEQPPACKLHPDGPHNEALAPLAVVRVERRLCHRRHHHVTDSIGLPRHGEHHDHRWVWHRTLRSVAGPQAIEVLMLHSTVHYPASVRVSPAQPA